jgi:hypothetical protein
MPCTSLRAKENHKLLISFISAYDNAAFIKEIALQPHGTGITLLEF